MVLDQWKGQGGSLQAREYDAKKEDWAVVNATKRFDPRPSESDLQFDKVIQKGTQEVQDIVAQHLHGREQRGQ